MRRFVHFRKSNGAQPVALVHRDVRGKALSLLLLLVLAFTAFHFAQYVPGGTVAARGDAVGAAVDREDSVALDPARAADPVEIRGLDYLLPRQVKKGAAARSALEMMRDQGLLRGYSVPSRRLAFSLDGSCVIMPPSPVVEGPRGVYVVYHGNREKKRVALTFDTSEVGEPKAAKGIIDELTRLRAPATFFVCGAWCYKNPDLLRLAVDRGFEIASHSFNHPVMTGLPNEQVIGQLRSTEEAVLKVSGSRISAYFRPPYGATDARVEQLAAQLGYYTVMWNVDTNDWRETTVRNLVRDRATLGISGGEIVLMHTLGNHTSEALAEIVTNLRAMGFQLTTVTGVLEL